jgi:FKBP-type peptidyl-prolyl cis-trans isomerase
MNNKDTGLIASFVIICIVVAVGLYFGLRNPSTDAPVNDINTQEPNQNNMSEEQSTKVAENGKRISMNYTGRLEDGTAFDSNVDPKFNHVEPFIFTLGAGQVIKGWDEGILGMKVGEKKTLTIPPEKAYGPNGIPGVIPPNATLIFDVEVVDVL